MTAPRLAALTIDLDGLRHYHRIHGLPAPRPGPDPVYGAAVERFGALCARLGVRGTAFCVGEDLADPAAAAAVRRLAEAGHELGNHTLSHDYGLARRAPEAIAAEVRGGAEALRRAAGRAPVGFRAPGYALSPALLAALAADGYRYDASAFPSLPYHLAKGAVLLGLRLAGRRSASRADRLRVLSAPRAPYRPAAAEPYAAARDGGLPLLELPVATGLLGFPLVGTFLATLPAGAARCLAAGAARRPLLALELHGFDLLAPDEVDPALAAVRRDVRVPLALRLRRLEAFARGLRERTWVTLAEAAERLGGPAPSPARLGAFTTRG